MNTPRIESTGRKPGCVTNTEVFQHPLMEEPPAPSAGKVVRRQAADLTNRARALCSGCPLATACLYDAVVKHDVSGFVAGTTETERKQIRRRLGVTVEPEDFDSLAGSFRSGKRVDHDEVVRLRQANPHESLEMLAQRLECSLSTVKRHLRKHRRGESSEPATRRVPTQAELLQAAGMMPDRSSGAA
ncbi:WhiB family transcriptional regulator [Naumannella halotolerans]|uniref:WhiB family transcriptional regulator n=1 Tax=Naumannella halotolerans TaxID=993414 RepID=UPI00370DE21F